MDVLGEYIFVCLVFVVFALLEFALIIILNRKTSTKNKQEKRESSLLQDENNSELTKHGVAGIAFIADHSKETSLPNTNQERMLSMERGMRCIPSTQPIHLIDLTASFIFPLAFVIYNCYYWGRTLDEGKLDN